MSHTHAGRSVKLPPSPVSTELMDETAAAIQKVATAVFAAQRRAVRVALLGRAVKKAAGSDVVTDDELRALIKAVEDAPWDDDARQALRDALENLAQHGATAAAKQVMELTGDDDAVAALTQANQDAVQWARARTGNLITKVSDTTRNLVNELVSGAIASGETNSDLADTLDGAFLFGADRAEMIAATETQFAANFGSLAGYAAAGVQEVEWYGEDPCEECEENVAAGPIPIGTVFPSGDEAPPAHPWCKCSIGAVVKLRTDKPQPVST